MHKLFSAGRNTDSRPIIIIFYAVSKYQGCDFLSLSVILSLVLFHFLFLSSRSVSVSYFISFFWSIKKHCLVRVKHQQELCSLLSCFIPLFHRKLTLFSGNGPPPFHQIGAPLIFRNCNLRFIMARQKRPLAMDSYQRARKQGRHPAVEKSFIEFC